MFYKNSKIDYFWILFFIKTILMFYIFPIIAPILLLFVLAYMIFYKIDLKNKLIAISIAFLIYFSLLFNKHTKIYFGDWIDSMFSFSIRDWTINFIKNNYSDKSESLILLMGFGIKKNDNFNIYEIFITLSISHLIIVSGYHLSFLSRFFKKIFKNYYLRISVLVIFMLIINYNLDFNFGILRSSIFLLLMSNPNKKNNPLHMLSFSGIIILFFCPLSLTNFSFLMSYIATYLLIVITYKKDNKIIKFASPIFINILLLPIISQFSEHISITGILFSFFYSSIFCYLFLFSTFCFWFINLDFIFSWFYDALYFLLDTFLNFNFKIEIFNWSIIMITIFYMIFFSFIAKKLNE
ncbi:MAG: ComEC/Rec2 family competence protein [Mycoplasmoidaceae bacterium]